MWSFPFYGQTNGFALNVENLWKPSIKFKDEQTMKVWKNLPKNVERIVKKNAQHIFEDIYVKRIAREKPTKTQPLRPTVSPHPSLKWVKILHTQRKKCHLKCSLIRYSRR